VVLAKRKMYPSSYVRLTRKAGQRERKSHGCVCGVTKGIPHRERVDERRPVEEGREGSAAKKKGRRVEGSQHWDQRRGGVSPATPRRAQKATVIGKKGDPT